MSTRGIDYAKLSLRDALDLAVLIEEEAKERYEEFATQMDTHHTPDAARFFRMMARNEERHRAELADRRAQLFAKAPTTIGRESLFDVEAPDYDEARALMTPRGALEAALRSETKAWSFFSQALPRAKDKEVSALFEQLRDEEVLHQELVKKELAKLPSDDGFVAEDFEDEPVSQD